MDGERAQHGSSTPSETLLPARAGSELPPSGSNKPDASIPVSRELDKVRVSCTPYLELSRPQRARLEALVSHTQGL